MARDLEADRRPRRRRRRRARAARKHRPPDRAAPQGAGAASRGVAPDNAALGVMLPYAPLHHLLFDAGAPDLLVMTSANRSSEPIAYRDADALRSLRGIADAFLVGDRPIARRVDDGVAQVVAGDAVVRRARGMAPAPVVRDARFEDPVLALGAELKRSVTLAVGGAAYVSQHLGDLSDLASFEAFRETVADLCAMYGVDPHEVLVAHDRHPAYPKPFRGRPRRADRRDRPPRGARGERAGRARRVDDPTLGFAFDGAGLGDDGTMWGGEVFHGSLPAGSRGWPTCVRRGCRAATGRRAPRCRRPWAGSGRSATRPSSGWRGRRSTSRWSGCGSRASSWRPTCGAPSRPASGGCSTRWPRSPASTGRCASRGRRRSGSRRPHGPSADEAPYPWPFALRDGAAVPADLGPRAAARRGARRRRGRSGPKALVARRFHEAVAAGVVEAALRAPGGAPVRGARALGRRVPEPSCWSSGRGCARGSLGSDGVAAPARPDQRRWGVARAGGAGRRSPLTGPRRCSASTRRGVRRARARSRRVRGRSVPYRWRPSSVGGRV